MKPLIRKSRLGWDCTLDGAVAIGDTPVEAYNSFCELFGSLFPDSVTGKDLKMMARHAMGSGALLAKLDDAPLLDHSAQRRRLLEMTLLTDRAEMASSQFWNEEPLTNEQSRYEFEKVSKDAKN